MIYLLITGPVYNQHRSNCEPVLKRAGLAIPAYLEEDDILQVPLPALEGLEVNFRNFFQDLNSREFFPRCLYEVSCNSKDFYVKISTDDPKRGCICDTFTVLMVTGCRCGAIQK